MYKELIKICGSKNVSDDPEILKSYTHDLSFFEGKPPKYVVWPLNTKIVEKTLKLANKTGFSIIPVSSDGPRHHGDTIPQKENSIILNFSKMKKILNIDKKNRVVMVEPGVTFGQLIPKLRKKGLRLLLPLFPRKNKSVLTSALEREPITIPRYHWDSSDPLLCTEVVFGTGDLFRTGTAAGPGTIKEQKKSGGAQVNPMGPTQFSLFRVIQGAQGSLGVLTWATLKLEFLPSIQKVFHIHSDNLQELLDFQQNLIKFRLCDETFILNNLNLASLIKQKKEEIETLSNKLSKWNLIYVISGRAKLADDKIIYLERDINDIIKSLNVNKSKFCTTISEVEIINCVSESAVAPWRARYKGSYQDIFFITNFERITEFISKVETIYNKNLGIYIQPINQGTSYHCEFDLFYDSKDEEESSKVKEKFLEISVKLMDSGAFFNRPYGIWAKEAYKRQSEQTIIALKKVKQIFDPNNILNPGVLCFDN